MDITLAASMQQRAQRAQRNELSGSEASEESGMDNGQWRMDLRYIYKQMEKHFKMIISQKNVSLEFDNDLYEKLNKINLSGTANDYKKFTSNDLVYVRGFAHLQLEPLINKYNEYLKMPKRLNFLTGEFVDLHASDREKIEREFWNQTDNFTLTNQICENCNQTLAKNQIKCPECFHEYKDFGSSYNDLMRTNFNNKYIYLRKQHFYDCIIQFQGKQSVNFDQELITKLTVLYKKLNSKEKLSKNVLMKWLKSLDAVRQYENIHLIYSIITGIPCANLAEYENRLLADFEQFLKQYDQKFCKIENRKNFISVQYLLYQFLSRYHYPCTQNDFILPRTLEIRKKYDQICGQIFNELKWNCISLI